MKELLQTAAGELVRGALSGVAVDPRDVPGAPDGMHDLDVLLSDGSRVPVEVTMATKRDAREMWDAIGRHDWTEPCLSRSWSVVIRGGTRIQVLRRHVGPLLAELEALGIDRFNAPEPVEGPASAAMKELVALGVRYARSVPDPTDPPMILVGTVGPGEWLGDDAIADALEHEASKADNIRKLRAAGGGHLFVWIDVYANAAHAAMCAEPFATPRSPVLPDVVEAAWVARCVLRPDGAPVAADVLHWDRRAGWVQVTPEPVGTGSATRLST